LPERGSAVVAKPVRHRGKWRIRPVNEHGQRESYVFDTEKEALRGLRRREVEVDEVKRGLRASTPADKIFDELADYWVATRVPQKRSGHHDESIIRCHLRPHFGKLRMRDFLGEKGVKAVDEFIVSRMHLDKKTVLNIVTLLGSMLNVAVEFGWLAKMPKIRRPKVRLFNKDFRFLRTDDEVRRFLASSRDEGECVYTMYTTAVYTGLRAGELAGLHRDDVDFSTRLICVQRSYDGPTKAEDVRYVPILDALLPVLRAWMLRCPGRYVFPNQAGAMHGPSSRVFQEVLHRVLDSAGFPMVERKGKPVRYVCFHDLRHTFASSWVRHGGDLFKLRSILGHKTIQMTMRYAHLVPNQFDVDHGRLGEALPEMGEVIAFPTAR
jgi:hypothetical protein